MNRFTKLFRRLGKILIVFFYSFKWPYKSIVVDTQELLPNRSKAILQLINSEEALPAAEVNEAEIPVEEIKRMQRLKTENKFEESIIIAKRVIDENPNRPMPYITIGHILIDLGLYKEALPYLQKVVELDKVSNSFKAMSLCDIGKCNFILNNRHEAKSILTEAIKFNYEGNAAHPPQNQLRILGFDEAFSDWITYESANFIFHFQPGTPVNYKVYINIRETALRNINQFFNATLPKKIDFFAWHTPEYANEILGRTLGFAVPNLALIHSRYNQSPGHEITHIISHYAAGAGPKTKLVNEGIAVCFNQVKGNKLHAAKSIMKKTGIPEKPIKDLWTGWSGKSDNVYYPAAGAFIEYLIEKEGKDKILQLNKNQTLENAYRIYGDKLDQIISEFEDKLFDLKLSSIH